MTITLSDEERRNALSDEMITALMSAIDVAEGDSTVRVVILTNKGSVFCAGANLSERSRSTPTGRTFQLDELLRRISLSPKPFVGRLAGHCVAGGVGLAAVTDVSVAIESATFGFSEVRVGVAPAIISVVCLPKMRRGDAQSAFLRGTRFSAREAANLGLINQAVPPESLDHEVESIVNDLLAGEPNALAAVKLLTSSVPTMSEEEAFAWTAELSATLFASNEAKEGMRAFLEKRPASWVQSVPTSQPGQSGSV
ncbi:MAG: Enoyl-CoA hydratase/isomerase [Acidimicrobiaceae bacterium]|nr:Enoyl-CoA hydratase/isomerase [Acidimicrobiaceae bacterium]